MSFMADLIQMNARELAMDKTKNKRKIKFKFLFARRGKRYMHSRIRHANFGKTKILKKFLFRLDYMHFI